MVPLGSPARREADDEEADLPCPDFDCDWVAAGLAIAGGFIGVIGGKTGGGGGGRWGRGCTVEAKQFEACGKVWIDGMPKA